MCVCVCVCVHVCVHECVCECVCVLDGSKDCIGSVRSLGTHADRDKKGTRDKPSAKKKVGWW